MAEEWWRAPVWLKPLVVLIALIKIYEMLNARGMTNFAVNMIFFLLIGVAFIVYKSLDDSFWTDW